MRNTAGTIRAGRPSATAGRTAALAIALVAASPAATLAQAAWFAEGPASREQERLRELFETGDYKLWTQDTVLAVTDTVETNLVVLGASLRSAGAVHGDLFVVDGDLFLRDGARVRGDVIALASGYYDSGPAEVGGEVVYRPNASLRVRPSRGGFEIISQDQPRRAWDLDGIWGVRAPQYQRADGLVPEIGGLYRAWGVPGNPEIEAIGRVRIADSGLDGFLRASVHPIAQVRMGVFAERGTFTIDDWIRPAPYNSLAYLFAGRGQDAFDYFVAAQVGIDGEIVSARPPVWEEDAPTWRLFFSAGLEEISPAGDVAPFTLSGNTELEGTWSRWYSGTASPLRAAFVVRAGFEWDRTRRTGWAAFGIGLEQGWLPEKADAPEVHPANNHLFVEARANFNTLTSWGHTLSGHAIGRAHLQGDPAAQRVSALGGVGNLPNIPRGSVRGGDMAYAEATYGVPLLGSLDVGGVDAFARVSAATVEANTAGRGAVSGGLSLRFWGWRAEFGAAAGQTLRGYRPDMTPDAALLDSSPDLGTSPVVFFEIATRRAVRPSRHSRPSRSLP